MDKPPAPSFSSNIIAKTAGNIKQFGGFSENWTVEKMRISLWEKGCGKVEMWKNFLKRKGSGKKSAGEKRKKGKRRGSFPQRNPHC